MTIAQADRNRYEGYAEELTAKLRRCHPDEENDIREELEATKKVFKALEDLDLIIRGVKQ